MYWHKPRLLYPLGSSILFWQLQVNITPTAMHVCVHVSWCACIWSCFWKGILLNFYVLRSIFLMQFSFVLFNVSDTWLNIHLLMENGKQGKDNLCALNISNYLPMCFFTKNPPSETDIFNACIYYVCKSVCTSDCLCLTIAGTSQVWIYSS